MRVPGHQRRSAWRWTAALRGWPSLLLHGCVVASEPEQNPAQAASFTVNGYRRRRPG
jgi:hypothetical protein